MLIIDSPTCVNIDSIFWQPFFACTKEQPCFEQCYIAQSNFYGKQCAKADTILNAIFKDPEFFCRLLTISFDSKLAQEEYGYGVIQERLDFLFKLMFYCETSTKPLPDIDIAIRRADLIPPGLYKYIRYVWSKIPDPFDNDKVRGSILLSTGYEQIDPDYLILEKPIGLPWTKGNQEANMNMQISCLMFFAVEAEHLISIMPDPKKTLKKVKFDRCLREKGECNCGWDRCHIFPDGTITGCPYDSFGVGLKAKIESSLPKAIREMRNSKSRLICPIKDALRVMRASSTLDRVKRIIETLMEKHKWQM